MSKVETLFHLTINAVERCGRAQLQLPSGAEMLPLRR